MGVFRLPAGLLAVLLLTSCGDVSAPPPQSLLLISLDTTRADHLPFYGYDRPTMPRLAELAAGGVVFDAAYAQETNTNPSHASMFTGLYPHRHGNRTNGQVLAPDRVTLAQLLAAEGFATAAFVSGYTMTARTTGFERGFTVYDDELGGPRRPAAATVERALSWLGERRPGERSFLFVHLFDAHGPYRPPAPWDRRFTSEQPGERLDEVPSHQLRYDAAGEPILHLGPYRDAYDGALAYMDDQLARLLAAVDLETTLVAVVADHGETLAERYWDLAHGGAVFDEQIHIPLLLHLPGPTGRELAGRRVGELVETVDLLPTLLEALQVAVPPQLPRDGASLLPRLAGKGRAPPPRPVVYATARAEDRRYADRSYRLDPARRIATVRAARYKLIRFPGLGGDYEELYDLRADAGETHDLLAAGEPLAAEAEAALAELRRLLERWLAGADPEIPLPELAPEDREKLRALGYLGG
jgi:arylsulfatase